MSGSLVAYFVCLLFGAVRLSELLGLKLLSAAVAGNNVDESGEKVN